MGQAGGHRRLDRQLEEHPDLDQRLEKLIAVARSERFKLAIIYQGLDFQREPLAAERVAFDLDRFIERYAGDEVFGPSPSR